MWVLAGLLAQPGYCAWHVLKDLRVEGLGGCKDVGRHDTANCRGQKARAEHHPAAVAELGVLEHLSDPLSCSAVGRTGPGVQTQHDAEAVTWPALAHGV